MSFPLAGQPGVNVVNGQIQIVGNMGTVNNITLAAGDLTDNGTTLPINFTQAQSANGESASTNFVVYDSLGTPITVDMTAVLQSTASNATTYRYYFTSPENDGPSTSIGDRNDRLRQLGTGCLGRHGDLFHRSQRHGGRQSDGHHGQFSGISGISSSTEGSTLSLASQNGAAPGTLTSYSVDPNGVINGSFSNGATETLGQVMLASFTNDQGLVQTGNGTYTVGTNSGPPTLAAPNSSGVRLPPVGSDRGIQHGYRNESRQSHQRFNQLSGRCTCD